MLWRSHSRPLLLVSLTACLSSFNFGFDQGVISPLQALQPRRVKEVLMVFPGAGFLGSLFAYLPTEHWGRRKTLIGNCAVNTAGSVAAALGLFIKAYEYSDPAWLSLFVIGRCLSGIASGVSSFLVPLYIKELTLDKHLGSIGSIHQIMITAGISSAYCLGILCYYSYFVHGSWAIVLVPVVISLIEAAVFSFKLKFESPTFLWVEGKRQRALEVIYHLHDIETPCDVTEEDEAASPSSVNPSFSAVCTQKNFRRPLLMACGLSLFQQFTGVNSIIMSSSKIFEFTSIDVQYEMMFIGLANSLSAVSILFFINRVGRTTVLQIGGIGMAIGMSLLAVSFSGLRGEGYAFSGAFIFICMFEVSVGTVQWFYNVELLPPKGVAIATAANWFCNFIIGVIVSLETNDTREYSCIAYAAFSVLLVVFARFYLIETRDHSPEDIERILTGK